MREKFDALKEQIRKMLETMKSVKGFRLDKINAIILNASDQMASNNVDIAMSAAAHSLDAGRNILGGFIRNSVQPYKAKDGTDRMLDGKFVVEIRNRANENYHDDIVDGLKAKLGKLEEAVQKNSNEHFEERIAAYNAMVDAIEEADREQKWRDERRISRDAALKAAKTKKKEAKKASGVVDTTAMREAMLATQQQQNKTMAEELRALIG